MPPSSHATPTHQPSPTKLHPWAEKLLSVRSIAMPSDTVWVALIGGGVTVASLGMQGWLNRGAEKRRNEREDRHRREDRAEAIRQVDHVQRRDLYRRLLDAANRAYTGVTIFSLTRRLGTVDQREVAAAAAQMNAELSNFSTARAETDITSFSEDVIEQARRFGVAAATAAGVIMTEEPSESAIVKKTYGHALNEVREAHERLRIACRRDLGYDAETQ